MPTYVIFDTETTGLIKSRDFPLELCPKIIEFYGEKIDENFNVLGKLHLFIDPMEPLTEEIIGITNITEGMVRGKGNIKHHWPKIKEFVVDGVDGLIGHNASFDVDMLIIEARRAGDKDFHPPMGWCSVEWCQANVGRRLNLTKFVAMFAGIDHKGAHRADADVSVLVKTLHKLQKDGNDLELPTKETLGGYYQRVIEKYKLPPVVAIRR